MNAQIQKIVLALILIVSAMASPARTTFPIANNPAVVQFSGGTAFDGTNYFVIMATKTALTGQLFAPSGALIGTQIAIGGHPGLPPAAAVAFGRTNYLVVWSDSSVKSGATMFGQFISRTGAKIGTRFNLLSSRGSHGSQIVQALATDGTNFLLVWQDDNDRSFWGQIITPAGTLSGSEFLISNQEQNGKFASVTYGASQYLVVWQSNNGPDGDMNQTFGAFVSTDGVAQSPFQISDNQSTDQNPLAVAFDGNNYFVAWSWDPGPETFTSVTNWDLRGRLVSPLGSLVSGELNLTTDSGSEIFPTLAFDGTKYLMAWGRINYNDDVSFNPNDSNIYLQFFDTTGQPIGSEFSVFTRDGKNTPFLPYHGLTFGGERFALAGTLGSVTSSNGSIVGFPSAEVFGAFILTAAPTGNLHFDATPTLVAPGAYVNFSAPAIDSLGHNIVSWQWDFGDGTTSSDQNPSHIYTKVGAFNVALTMANDQLAALTGPGPTVTVSSPTAQFVADPVLGILPLTVQFTGPDDDEFGTALTSWHWDFGDGTTDTSQSPSHNYTRAGTFIPTLLATNNNGVAVRGSGPAITVLAYTAANHFIASDSWHDALFNDPDAGPSVRTTAHASLSATLPLSSDISSFDETTPYDIELGDLSLSGSLGDDPTYHKGKTSISFRQTDDTTGAVTATMTLSWTAKSFTIVASAGFDAFGAEGFYGGTTGAIHDTTPATLALGDTSYDVTLYINGQNTDVFNDAASTDLNTGSISCQADFVGPTVTISSPVANFSTNNPAIIVIGTATDNISLNQVYWRWASATDDPRLGYFGYGDWQTVDSFNQIGTSAKSGAWSVALDMSGNGPGTNRLWVVSTDSSANASPIATRNFFYSLRSMLTLSTNGPGGITGGKGVTNGAQLEIGRGYTVTAKALGTSNVFLNWTDGSGNVLSPNATFNFIMQDSLTLQANFGPNPFPAIVSTYTGLFFDVDNGVSVDTAGYLSVAPTKTGSYTGTLMLGTGRYPFSGQLLFEGNPDDSAAADSAFVIKRGALAPIYGNLHVPSNSGVGLSNSVTGNVEIFDTAQNQWVLVPLMLAQSHYSPGIPVPGLFNLQIPTSAGSGQNGPVGYGYGTANASLASVAGSLVGNVTLSLHVADGNVAPVSFSSSLAADGSFPFFIPLYAGKGLIMGWLTFTNEFVDDLRGENITWLKLPNPANKFYPNGFDRTMEVTGSHYNAPKAGTNIVGWTAGLLDFADANVSGEIAVTFNPKSNTFTANPGQGSIVSKATLTFAAATGTLSGNLTPANGKPFSFTALVLPEANNAYGFFLDTDQSGSILVRPAP